jgi:hypothetical protein
VKDAKPTRYTIVSLLFFCALGVTGVNKSAAHRITQKKEAGQRIAVNGKSLS